MGWYGIYGAKPKDLKKNILSELGDSLVDHKTTCYGRRLWVVAKSHTGQKLIGLYLMQKGGHVWMYKPMDETMHPYYYDCPLSLLKKVDEPINENSEKWREKVRYYHTQQKKLRKLAAEL